MTPLLEAGAATAVEEGLRVSAPGIVLALGGAALLYFVLRRLRGILEAAPLGAARRRMMRRARPLAEALVFIGYVVLAVPFVLGGSPATSAVVLGLMVALFVALTWFAIRDAVAGLLLKASELCQPGDVVEVDGLRGRVRGLGFRVLALETEAGGEAFIPYSKLSRHSLVRVAGSEGVHRHGFLVASPPGLDPAEAIAIARRAALTCHWSLATREPEVTPAEGGLAVTVFALEASRAPLIEAEVRKALGAAANDPRDGAPPGP